MQDANPIGGTLPVFEWGQYAYVRIGNVVPPLPSGADATNPDPATVQPYLVQDPNDPAGATFYGNGSAVTFRVGDVSDPAAFAPTMTIPAVVLTSLAGTPAPNGIMKRTGTDKGIGAGPPSNPYSVPGATETLHGSLKDQAIPDGHGWFAAYSYPIGGVFDRTGDTPGARREILEAHQTATRYTYTPPASGIGAGTYTASGTLDLIATQGIGTQITQTDPTTGLPTGVVQLPPWSSRLTAF